MGVFKTKQHRKIAIAGVLALLGAATMVAIQFGALDLLWPKPKQQGPDTGELIRLHEIRQQRAECSRAHERMRQAKETWRLLGLARLNLQLDLF